MSGHREITHEEWKREGAAKFGDDVRNWAFECPACHHVAKASEWVDGGKPGMIAFSCVGRLREFARDAFAKGDGPCNYAGGGLFGLNPVRVKFPDGTTGDYFEFAALNAEPQS